MSSLQFRGVIAALLFMMIPSFSDASEQVVFVDLKNARILHYYGENKEPDIYPIVLPRTNVQRLMRLVRPIHGTFTRADYKPTWWPTENMRRKDPSLPRAVHYGEARHPIGIYRLRIAWQNPVNPRFWDAVRIHGGARADDLYEGKSSGCFRMLDSDVTRMVNIIESHGGEARVTVMPPQFM